MAEQVSTSARRKAMRSPAFLKKQKSTLAQLRQRYKFAKVPTTPTSTSSSTTTPSVPKTVTMPESASSVDRDTLLKFALRAVREGLREGSLEERDPADCTGLIPTPAPRDRAARLARVLKASRHKK